MQTCGSLARPKSLRINGQRPCPRPESCCCRWGYDKESFDIFERLSNRPDRNSGISTSSSLMEGRNLTFTRWPCAVIAAPLGGTKLVRLVDMVSSDGPSLAARPQTDLAQIRASDLIAGGTGLVDLLRPYGPRSLDRPWLAPGVWHLFGPGPVAAAARDLIAGVQPEEEAAEDLSASYFGRDFGGSREPIPMKPRSS